MPAKDNDRSSLKETTADVSDLAITQPMYPYLFVNLRERIDKDNGLLQHHVLDGPVLVVSSDGLHRRQALHPADDAPEHRVLVVQMLARSEGDVTKEKNICQQKSFSVEEPQMMLHLVKRVNLSPG